MLENRVRIESVFNNYSTPNSEIKKVNYVFFALLEMAREFLDC